MRRARKNVESFLKLNTILQRSRHTQKSLQSFTKLSCARYIYTMYVYEFYIPVQCTNFKTRDTSVHLYTKQLENKRITTTFIRTI